MGGRLEGSWGGWLVDGGGVGRDGWISGGGVGGVLVRGGVGCRWVMVCWVDVLVRGGVGGCGG